MQKWRSRPFALLAGGLLSSCAPHPARSEPVHLILVGDSTIARVTGYGDALCARFDALTKCENLARGGRSSKSYRAEGMWDEALAHAREPGYRTFVLIQFGHNDQPGKAERSTTLPEFRTNMRRYTDEVRAAGVFPLLVTPLTRRTFRTGNLVDGLGPWAETTADVAGDSGTVLLDLHRDSMAAVAAHRSTVKRFGWPNCHRPTLPSRRRQPAPPSRSASRRPRRAACTFRRSTTRIWGRRALDCSPASSPRRSPGRFPDWPSICAAIPATRQQDARNQSQFAAICCSVRGCGGVK